MNIKNTIKATLAILLVFNLALPLSAHDKKKKKEDQRGILEKMEAVPCGAKQTGLAGLGALWGSAGITHINTNEKMCPQYLLRTDDMDYEIRPIDLKHATILPIGKEGAFKIRKNEMILTMTEGSDLKPRDYEVVAMNPANPDNAESRSSSTPEPDATPKPLNPSGSGSDTGH
ncbi:MAG TPA: hypothetical protein VL986_13165 [Terracidiphilus sp.]|nr:hypothetical protein [Terracidiphilus sp.]